ncbi:MAG: PilN domain-containing protein [Vicinamibacterales bacterium]
MIRVNLLPTERRKTKAPAFGLQAAQKIALGGSLVLLLAGAFVGWRYWALGQEAAQLEVDIETQRREEQRLQQVILEVRDFEARRARLEQRVGLIEELRRGQTAPVHMLDQVSRSLPDMMWLTRMSQTGYDVTMDGNCLSLTALSDFVANLEGSRYFARPVEIVSSEVVAATQTTPELIRFTVKGTFQMSGLLPPPPPPSAAPPKKGGARG